MGEPGGRERGGLPEGRLDPLPFTVPREPLRALAFLDGVLVGCRYGFLGIEPLVEAHRQAVLDAIAGR